MNIVPGMIVKVVKSNIDYKVIYVQPDDLISMMNLNTMRVYPFDFDCELQPTGEVDWSLVPDGTEVEYQIMQGHWQKRRKIGYDYKINRIVLEFNDEYEYRPAINVRIPQPEPVPIPKPTIEPNIDFKIDPPKPGDEYICRGGSIAQFIGMCSHGDSLWIFELSNGVLARFFADGRVSSSKESPADIISRKPAEPIKHKEKFWVNIYYEFNGFRMASHRDRRSADSMACTQARASCKEIEIEFEEGEGL